jgi:DNA topoisomerase-1
MSNEEKQKEKEKKDKYEEKFKVAYVDGKEQATGNFRIEPPGIFLGRGCHPKAGKIKKRVYPEDITINIDTKSSIPALPKFYSEHKWGKIIHDNTLEWLCSWKDDITGKTKYVWLGAKSDFKAKSDENKFDTARKLAKNIIEIRRTNGNNIISDQVDSKTKQLASALYLIDNLALRVGNEKGEDEADTVGVCSLRVEHIKFLPDYKISLDFLGKDSVRYQNTVKIDPEVYNVLLGFTKGKSKSDDLFDLINPQMLNQYLGLMMEGLTAKVFRTYNASKLFQQELNEINSKIEKMNHDDSAMINLILDMYNKANV